MELGSPHDAIIDVAKAGVLLALEHNMLPKPILQEALRCTHHNCNRSGGWSAVRFLLRRALANDAPNSLLRYAGPS